MLRQSSLYQEHSFEAPAAHLAQLGEQTQQHLGTPRRTIVKNTGLLAITAYLGAKVPSFIKKPFKRLLRDVAEPTGEFADQFISAEQIITDPVVALEPRRFNYPTVEPKAHDGSTDITLTFAKNEMRLPLEQLLEGEHTGQRASSGQLFTSGLGIITTGEGLERGKQEFCQFFTNKKEGNEQEVIAIGFEGGLYRYAKGLGGTAEHESSGEWERLVIKDPTKPLPSRAVSHNAWQQSESRSSIDMLAKKIVTGTNLLRELGYKPFAAILPSTQMPEMKDITLGPDNCCASIQEVMQSEGLFVTQRGDLIDAAHLRAKADETLTLFTDLLSQYVSGEQRPTATIGYALGSSAEFIFNVDRQSIQPNNIHDATFMIMNAVSMQMEGITQRLLHEKLSSVKDKLPHFGYLNPEDMFTNSLGITGMMRMIKHFNVAERLMGPLRTIHQRSQHLSGQDLKEALQTALDDIKPQLVQYVLQDVARTHGIRKQTHKTTYRLPMGIYSLIPVKMREIDAATPTFLDTEASGIKPDNSEVRFKATHIPVVEAAAGRAVHELISSN